MNSEMFHVDGVGFNALDVGFIALDEIGSAGVGRWKKNPTFRWVFPTQRKRALEKRKIVELIQRSGLIEAVKHSACCEGRA